MNDRQTLIEVLKRLGDRQLQYIKMAGDAAENGEFDNKKRLLIELDGIKDAVNEVTLMLQDEGEW